MSVKHLLYPVRAGNEVIASIVQSSPLLALTSRADSPFQVTVMVLAVGQTHLEMYYSISSSNTKMKSKHVLSETFEVLLA